jgi:hypothetical protein
VVKTRVLLYEKLVKFVVLQCSHTKLFWNLELELELLSYKVVFTVRMSMLDKREHHDRVDYVDFESLN